MEVGKIYVDYKDGPDGWFGLFSGCERGVFNFPNNLWRWYVIDSRIVINYPRVDNYYGRRVATVKELEKIESILEHLGYTLIPGTLEISKIPVNNISKIIEKLERGEWSLLKETEKIKIIETLKGYVNN